MKRTEVNLLESRSTWPLRIKVRRAIWECFRPFFWSGTPRLLSPLRVFLLRLFGARIGKRVLIMGGVRVWMPWNLAIGDYCAIGRDVELYNFAHIEIGTNTVLSQYAYLCSATHDYSHPHMPLIWKPITIGSNCWVAAGVFVGPGTSIGDGAVVGACSVVTSNVAAWTVCAGNPCRYIKPRPLAEK